MNSETKLIILNKNLSGFRNKGIELSSKNVLNIYLCGPTVYDNVHIGNLRSVIIIDIIIRLLIYFKVSFNYIHNITDVDDKIIERAKKRKISEIELSGKFAKSYYKVLSMAGVVFPTFFPKVSSNIKKITKDIELLISNNYAYKLKKDVLFDVFSLRGYMDLSKKVVDDLKSVRDLKYVNKKKNKEDFVLWKMANNEEEINWNSSLGLGRPGWHSECFSIINNLLKGKTLDIHAGGTDLIFPHHENERIQFLAINNLEITKNWLHVSPLLFEGKKMSKSYGNVLLAKSFLKKYGINVLRYIFLNSHYSHELNFTQDLLSQAINFDSKIKETIKKVKILLFLNKKTFSFVNFLNTDDFKKKIVNLLLYDLNTNLVITELKIILKKINKLINEKKIMKDFFAVMLEFEKIKFILEILGFDFDFCLTYNLFIKRKINEWLLFKKKQMYFEADKIRSELIELDVI